VRVATKIFQVGRKLRSTRYTLAAISAYFVYSFALYSKLGFLNRHLITSSATGDNAQQVWFLAWPAHALKSGLNPFATTALDVPYGINLLSNTSMPLLGILFAPVTWMFGATATYNLLLQLALGVSATAAYFVARKLQLSQGAAFVVGLLYGFSSFFISQGQAHLFLTFAPVPPLVFWLLWRIVIQDGPVRKLAIGLGLLLAADLLISAERVVMMLFVGALALLVGALFASPEQRRVALAGLRRAFLPLAVTAGSLGIVPVLFSLFGPWGVRGNPHLWTGQHHGDLLEFVQPNVWYRPIANWSRVQSDPLLGASLERSFYIGIPLLIVVVYAAWSYRSLAITRIATVLFLLTSMLALGSSFWINGHDTTVPTPFGWTTHVPLLSAIIPPRYMLFVSLIAGFGAGAALDGWRQTVARLTGVRRATMGIAVGLICIAQAWCFIPAARFTADSIDVSSWFHSSEFRSVVAPESHTLFYPYPNPFFNHAMLIQADTEMRFEIVGGQAIIGDQDGHNQGITMNEPWEVSTVFMRALWGISTGTSLAGTELGTLPGLSHTMPPRTEETATKFREYVRRYDIATIIVTPFGVESDVVVDYLTDAFGPPEVRSAGEIRYWQVGS
jgi:hypothetical protein